MADRINDGGPAFPVVYEHGEATCEQHGMTLRDYFAGKALPVAAPASWNVGEDFLRPANYAEAAKDAYALADAMLKARSA